MDYEDLIYRLRKTAQNGDVCRKCPLCIDAADAIEILLTERDAAIKCLRNAGRGYCKYQECEFNKYPCIDCKSNGGKEDKWEFIGCNR